MAAVHVARALPGRAGTPCRGNDQAVTAAVHFANLTRLDTQAKGRRWRLVMIRTWIWIIIWWWWRWVANFKFKFGDSFFRLGSELQRKTARKKCQKWSKCLHRNLTRDIGIELHVWWVMLMWSLPLERANMASGSTTSCTAIKNNGR